MKKVLLLISLIISSVVSAQVLVIDGTHHLISENTFPLYLNGGTQLDFFTEQISLISGIEYNIVNGETGNDLSFNQVINLSESSIVPNGKVWKLVSLLNYTIDYVVSDSLIDGGYIFEIDGNGGALSLSSGWWGPSTQQNCMSYCIDLNEYHTDWYLPSKDELMLIQEFNSVNNVLEYPQFYYWSNDNYIINLQTGSYEVTSNSNAYYCVCIRQF